mgnify:FL=1
MPAGKLLELKRIGMSRVESMRVTRTDGLFMGNSHLTFADPANSTNLT